MLIHRLASLALVLSLLPASASAQTATANLQQFSLNGDVHSFARVRSARIAPTLRPAFALVFDYGHRPLQRSRITGGTERLEGAVDGLFAAHLRAGFAFTEWVELAIQMPVLQIENLGPAAGDYLSNTSANPGLGIGDLRIEGRFLPLREDMLFGLEVAPFVTLPTGSRGLLMSSGVPTFGAMVNASKHWERFHVAGHVGYELKPGHAVVGTSFASDDQVHFGAGVGVSPVVDVLDINLEFAGSGYVGPGRANVRDRALKDLLHTPMEAYVDARIKTPVGLSFLVGGGPGLSPAVGSPQFRVFGGVSYSPLAATAPKDGDNDGIADRDDACPEDPEDADEFEDADGCPDLDNDADGIADADDACPNDPEDGDGWEDADGCPDPDNDGDGVLDGDDNCPDEAGPQDNEGCPLPDTDGDGIADRDDACPEQAEDADGFEDEDGCPDLDNDADGIADSKDLCPNRPEEVNGFKDEDGCPDDVKTVVTGEKIVILDKILFYSGKDVIKPESTPILEAVGTVLTDHPRILKIRVEGHTDSRGKDEYNQDLSERRAAAVMAWLSDHGVAAERMVSQGFGESKPIATNDTSGGRQTNRRVEFTILEQELETKTEGVEVR